MTGKRPLPDYELEAQKIETEAREKAEAIRQAGQTQKPRALLVGRLYDLLSIEPVKGDRNEAKRRKILEDRVVELLSIAEGAQGNSGSQGRRGVTHGSDLDHGSDQAAQTDAQPVASSDSEAALLAELREQGIEAGITPSEPGFSAGFRAPAN